MLFKLRESNKTPQLFILGAVVLVLLVAFGVTGGGGLQTVKQAEAVESTTTWTYPTSGGIQVGAGPAEATVLFVPAVCANCYITRIVPDLVYQNDPDPVNHPDGTTANFNNSSLHGAWLHHMVLVNSCNTSIRVFASGNERSTWAAPAGYGYLQNCGTGWHVNYHIHNNTSATRGVAIKLVITYRTGETLTPLTPVNLDISNSGDGEYTIPEGYSDTHSGSGALGISGDYASTVQGTIVTMGGHVHNYGISVSAYNNRLGDYICTSTAGYGTGSRYLPTGGPGTPGHPAAGNALTLNQSYHEAGGSPDNRYHIQAMTGCAPTSAQAIICVGDVLRLHAQYNNTSSFPVFDAMGIMVVNVDTSLPDSDFDGTIDACEDNDGDGPRNSADNCPDWANTTQQLPVWPVPANDSDCDGFTTAIEAFVSTDSTAPAGHCAATAGANNEAPPDRWAADFDDNQVASTLDLVVYVLALNTATGNPNYVQRADLNGNGSITTLDLVAYVTMLNKSCGP